MLDNVKTVQAIYEAFGRGDVSAILARVTPDTAWDFAAPQPAAAWHAPVRGAGEVPRFLGDLGGSVEITRFEPREFVHSGPHVMVDVRIEYTVRSSGKAVAMDQIHWWTLADGRVARLRHFEDSAQVAAATA
jgi:ketosteroid isomerase-like protein